MNYPKTPTSKARKKNPKTLLSFRPEREISRERGVVTKSFLLGSTKDNMVFIKTKARILKIRA